MIKVHKNGAIASIEKMHPSGMYLVYARDAAGDIIDKIRCDDYRQAREYFRAFSKVAANRGPR